MYHLELLNVITSKNGLENMVELESFMGFHSLSKTSNLLYSPIVSFEVLQKELSIF